MVPEPDTTPLLDGRETTKLDGRVRPLDELTPLLLLLLLIARGMVEPVVGAVVVVVVVVVDAVVIG